jgi:hypothetical protein
MLPVLFRDDHWNVMCPSSCKTRGSYLDSKASYVYFDSILNFSGVMEKGNICFNHGVTTPERKIKKG